MTNSRAPEWHDAHEAERLVFLLGDLDERRRVIRRQAWHEGSWGAVYDEATAMRETIRELQERIGATYAALMERAKQ